MTKEEKDDIIGAAPELLDACRAALSLMSDADVSEMPAEAACRFAAIRWQLDVAIKKAEGRA